MDEFTDLDKELAKLREELSSHSDDWSRQFHFPASNDYWKKRQDEEKLLWQKRLSASDEERKALEEKLRDQRSQMEQYNTHLKDLEKKIEEDARRWEEKFKAREAELLLEKNRVLWEEKLNEKDNENHTLLTKISELNAKIGQEREHQLTDRDKAEEYLNKIKEAHEEKIKSYANQVEVLKDRALELEKNVEERIRELRLTSENYENRIKKSDEYTLELTRSRDGVLNENSILKEELAKAKLQNIEDKKQVSESFKQLTQQFVANFYTYLGPLLGLLHGIGSGRLSNKLVGPVKDSVQRLENETQLFISVMDVKFQYNNLYTFGLLLSEEEIPLFEKMANEQKLKTKVLGLKTFKKEILKVKPQTLVVSTKYYPYAAKIKSRWPFMPVILFGNISHKEQEKLKTKGFGIIARPFVSEEAVSLLNQTASKSVAWPEFWDKLKVRRSFLPKAVLVLGLFALCFSGYYAEQYYSNINAQAISHFVTPYPQPTNIAFDGENIWVCDWFGQSIYKHSAGKDFKLAKIFHFPEKHFTTLAWAGGYLWSADPWNKKIYKHNLDENLTIVATFPTPNAAPSGLAGNGKVLWSCDNALAKIYRHKLDANLTIEETYPSPGPSPSGLYFDGEKLWSIDSGTNKIYCHNIHNGLSVEKEYLPVGYEQKGFNLSGIALTKDKIWVCSERMGEIESYQKTLLRKIK